MKQLLIMAISLIMLSTSGAMAADKGEAIPVIKETTHNFGIISEKDGPVSHEFVITNEGKGNLIIYDATADCGCTKPEFPKNPIAPGKSGKIKVTFQPLGQLGSFKKAVTIKTNGKPSKLRVRITGSVNPNK